MRIKHIKQNSKYRVIVACNRVSWSKTTSEKNVCEFKVGDKYSIDSVTEKGNVVFVNINRLVEDDLLIETEGKTITLELFKNCFEEVDLIEDVLKENKIKL